MAIVSVNERTVNRRGALLAEDGEKTYERQYVVVTDTGADGPNVVANAAGIPILGSVYQSGNDLDPTALCIEVLPTQRGDERTKWDVAVKYSNKQPQGQTNPNPLLEPPRLSWGFAQFRRPVNFEIDGTPITNSAWEPFQIEIDDSRPVYRVTRNEPTYDVSRAIAYQDAINTDAFKGAAPYVAKVMSISGEWKFAGGIYYWEVAYEICFRRDGWRERVIDQGYQYLQGTGAARRQTPIYREFTHVQQPVPLDGNGGVLANPSPANLVVQTKRVLKELPFSVLALP